MKFSAQMRRPGSLCAVCKNKATLNTYIKQTMRVSILILFIVLTTLQLMLASSVRSQDMTIQKVTVGLNQQSLNDAFNQIEQQTTLRFFYRKAEVSAVSKLSLAPASRTIEQTLFELLKNTSLSFRQIDQNILIQANSQSAAAKRKIYGAVYDATSKQPVKFAMVELLRKSDLQLVSQANTDSTGAFQLATSDNSAHLLRITLIGYHLYSKEINDATELKLSPIYLNPDVQELKEVVIASQSPLVRQEVDRLSYNVQADPEKNINSLLDMLRKVPLVSVDADDNVKLKGSGSFKVLIDGHTSSLVVNDPKEIFRSMSASNILRIEVITIPPAKYDSEGLAGIINIITIKKVNDGYSGNIGTSYKFPNGPRTFGAFNFKSGKFSISSYAGWNEYNTPHTTFTNDRQSTYPISSTINQSGSAQTKSNQGYISTQLSYEIDSLNLISAILGYNGSNSHRTGSVYTDQRDTLDHTYQLDNDGRSHQHGYDLGLDYQLGFKTNKAQLLSFSYRFSSTNYSQQNVLTASQQLNYDIGNYNQDDRSGTNEHTIQLDYTHPLNNLEIEGGVKTILRNNFSTYNVGDAIPQGGGFVADPANSDHFTYQQNIYSIYNSYQLNLKKWTVKAGLRLEKTVVDANFSPNGVIAAPDYANLVPSIAVQDKLTQNTSINFGYTERIQRPGIMQLNPYVDRQNPDFITYGNPGLKPEVNHVISFSYGTFGKISVNAGLSYSFSNNTIQYISTLGADGVTSGTYKNIGENNDLEADLNINYPISNRINLSLNAQAGFETLKGYADSILVERRALIGNGNLYLGYKFDHNWRGGFNFQYYSPAITLQGTSSPYYYTSVSLSKSVFKQKLVITGSASNPYQKYLDYQYRTNDPRFTEISHNDIVYRRFNIGLNYRFGKLKEESIKKNKKSVQNDDIKVIPSTIPLN